MKTESEKMKRLLALDLLYNESIKGLNKPQNFSDLMLSSSEINICTAQLLRHRVFRMPTAIPTFT